MIGLLGPERGFYRAPPDEKGGGARGGDDLASLVAPNIKRIDGEALGKLAERSRTELDADRAQPGRVNPWNLVNLFQGQLISRTKVPAIATALTAVLYTYVQNFGGGFSVPFEITGTFLTVTGLATAFRMGESTNRYNEGWKIWDDLGTTAKNLGREILNRVEVSGSEEARGLGADVIRLLQMFPISVGYHLQDKINSDVAKELNAILKRTQNKLDKGEILPQAILSEIDKRIVRLRVIGALNEHESVSLSGLVRTLNGCYDSCERIRQNPVPPRYTQAFSALLGLNSLTLITTSFGGASLLSNVAGGLLGYFFWWFNAASQELEEPFGKDIHDIPTGFLISDIVRNLDQALYENQEVKA